MGIMDLLKQLTDGVYDGERTDSEMNGVSSGFYIDNGIPVKYREGKSTKFFDGKENIRTPGKRTEERFVTDEEKTTFFQKYGFIRDMFGDHPEVMDYSHQYYEDRKKKK
jgi:hypothetical protein